MQRATQLFAFVSGQAGSEMQYLFSDSSYVGGLEVRRGATGMEKSTGIEASFLIEHQANSPASTLDRFVATSTLGHTARRAFRAVDSRQTAVRERTICDLLDLLTVGNV
jgi:hypothetical protein